MKVYPLNRSFNIAISSRPDRIYQYQQFGYSFSSVERLLHATGGDGLLALLNQTLEEAMLAQGFSQVFINEIVSPIARASYVQSVRLHAFVGTSAQTRILFKSLLKH